MKRRGVVGSFRKLATGAVLSLVALVAADASRAIAGEVLATVGQWQVLRGTDGPAGRCVLRKQEASGNYEISLSGNPGERFLVHGSVGQVLQALDTLKGGTQRVQATMQYDGAREQRLVKLSGHEFSFGESEQLGNATGFKVSLMLVPKSTPTDVIAESHMGVVVEYSLIRFGKVAPWLEKPECR